MPGDKVALAVAVEVVAGCARHCRCSCARTITEPSQADDVNRVRVVVEQTRHGRRTRCRWHVELTLTCNWAGDDAVAGNQRCTACRRAPEDRRLPVASN